MDRQKMLLIFGGAWVSAALLTWFLYAQTKGPKTEKTLACVVANHDMQTGAKVKKSDIRLVRLPEKALPKSAITSEELAVDRVMLFPVSANEPLTNFKLTSTTRAEGLASTIEPGKRAISVQVTDTSGVAGLIQPRSHVDVLFTRPGSMAEAVTTTIMEDVVVLSVGRATEVNQSNAVDSRASRPSTTAATLVVTPEQARKLELAKNEGKISLSLRNPLDHSDGVDNSPTTAEALNIAQQMIGRKRYKGPNVRDPKVWEELTVGAPAKPKEEKKEPPKPRLVVDVYRGDKHVQEVFQ
jgi:pilus assembly protein CpaB